MRLEDRKFLDERGGSFAAVDAFELRDEKHEKGEHNSDERTRNNGGYRFRTQHGKDIISPLFLAANHAIFFRQKGTQQWQKFTSTSRAMLRTIKCCSTIPLAFHSRRAQASQSRK